MFRPHLTSWVRSLLPCVVAALAVFILIRASLQSFTVVGYSMEPTFRDGQLIIVEKISYRFGAPRRGDVVVLRYHDGKALDFLIKRVVALPGDVVEIKDGKLFFCEDKDKCSSAEEHSGIRVTMGNLAEPVRMQIPADSFFVMGDNGDHSTDSRTFGAVPRQDIFGKAWLAVWPRDRIGLVADPTSTSASGSNELDPSSTKGP